MSLRVFAICILFFCSRLITSAQEKQLGEFDRKTDVLGLSSVKVGVNFGNQRGGGVILCPGGLIVTCKHVIQGFNEGRVELKGGEQLSFKILREVKDMDLVFLLTEKPTKTPLLKLRRNESLVEGEALICRAMIGGTIMCTINGSLACSPQQSVARVLLAQVPLSPGASGSPIVDSNGNLVGIVLGPLSESITDFARAWSSDVIRETIVCEFGSAVESVLAAKLNSDNDSGKIEVLASSSNRLLQGDLLLKVGNEEVSSYYELVCVVTPLLERKVKGFELSVLRNGQLVQVFVGAN